MILLINDQIPATQYVIPTCSKIMLPVQKVTPNLSSLPPKIEFLSLVQDYFPHQALQNFPWLKPHQPRRM